MNKHKDLIFILVIVIIGMFIPFLGSILITFGLDITNLDNISKIGSTFGWFLAIFGIEIATVYLYYHISNTAASKKMDKYKPK